MKKQQIKPYILYLNQLAQEHNIDIYIVGGFLRDYYLTKKISTDLDFIVSASAKKIATLFSQKFKGVFVPLHEEEQIYRVVVFLDNIKLYFDFSKMRGNLKEDIKQRDFTINSLAWKLEPSLKFDNYIDYTNSLKHIKSKKIKCIDVKCFNEDPLRLLRAYRFAATLNFSIEPKTYKVIKDKSKLIVKPSKERINYELKKILETDKSFPYILEMQNVGILDNVFTEIEILKDKRKVYFHKKGLLGHSLEVLFCLEFIIKNLDCIFNKKIVSFINKSLEDDNVISNLKLGTLFHDLGKPDTFGIIDERIRFFGHEQVSNKLVSKMLKRLKFSNKDSSFIKTVVNYHMRLDNLSKSKDLTKKAYYRYFRDLDNASVPVILLSLADCIASVRGSSTNKSYNDGITKKELKSKDLKRFVIISKNLIDWKIDSTKIKKKKRIINGKEIMEIFNLKEGKQIGGILDIIDEEYALGNIKTKKQAIKYIKNLEF